MPKEKLIDIDRKNLALTIAGGGSGCVTPLVLKMYVDPQLPNGVPYINEILPMPWSSPSTFISMLAGGVSLIAGIFIKPARYFLLPFGVTSLVTGGMLALVTPESSPSGRLQQKIPSSNIRLRAAGDPSRVVNQPSGSNFIQKSPQQRLQELQKESADIELQKQVKELEEANRFKKGQSSSTIPLRT